MRNTGASASFLEAAADPYMAGLSENKIKALREWITEKAWDRLYGCIIFRNGRIGAEFYGGGVSGWLTPDPLLYGGRQLLETTC